MKLAFKVFGLFIAAALLLVPKAAYAASDISGHWAEKTINGSIAQGVISGYADGTFKPNNPIKRSEFIALANRSMGFSASSGASFNDVSQADWFYNDVRIAQGAGYISGYPDGSFRPQETLTRETAAVMAANMLHLSPNTEFAEYFTDSGKLSWSKGAIGAAVKAGILSGYTNGEFRPGSAITRAEAVTLINRVSGRKYDSGLDTAYGYQNYYNNYVSGNASYISADRAAYQSTNLSATTSPESDGYYRMYNGNYGADNSIESFNGSILYDPTYAGIVKNITVSGDFAVSSFVNPDTDLELQNVTVSGTLVLNAVRNVTLKGCDINKIEFETETGGAEVNVLSGTVVNETHVYRTVRLTEASTSDTGFRNIYMDESCRSGVTLTVSGDFNTIYVNGIKSKLVLEKGTADTVQIVSDGGDCDVEVKKNASVNFMDVRSSCYVHGQGKIVLAKISADDAVFDLKPQSISGSKNPVYTSTAAESGSGGNGEYKVDITVEDVFGALLSGVSVSLGGLGEFITGSDGKVRFNGVTDGNYQCVISSFYTKPMIESITVNGSDVSATFQYDNRGKYTVIITVKKAGFPAAGANVTLGSQTLTASSDGRAVFTDIPAGVHDYTASFQGDTQGGLLEVVNMNVSREINFL